MCRCASSDSLLAFAEPEGMMAFTSSHFFETNRRSVETYNELKSTILDINQDLRSIIQKAGAIGGLSRDPLEVWKDTTNRVQRQLAEEMIRVAVVGSIKSGKSTLVNSLFGGDYVKRGAGVVTSIVTRIQPGDGMQARLEFKTWEEINAEMNHASVLFLAGGSDMPEENFDITREKDRLELEQSLANINAGQFISNDTRDPNSVLISAYLKGYDRVKGLVSFEPSTQVFEAEAFDKQKDFVGDESLAVYLKDILLSLVAPEGFGENVEIADCQGSDSPNPLHLAMIQDYLLHAHLIVYVVSSRTGLRQADIKFLNIIKKMGLLKNILFVVNCDFSEHESLEDMRGLVRRVQEEISLIREDPKVFSLSALFNLFTSLEKNGGALLRKDLLRLQQWREEEDMAAFSNEETSRLMKALVREISSNRLGLLLQTNLERIFAVASSVDDWIRLNHDLLSKDVDEVRAACAEMEKRREASDQVTMVIKDTLDGTTRKLKKDLSDDVERFFDLKYGDTIQGIVGFVDGYNIVVREYEQALETSGFLSTLYRVFQILRDATSRYMAESTNPMLVEFVGQGEERIRNVFDHVSGPYSLMIQDARERYHRTIEKLGIRIPARPFRPVPSPDIAVVKGDARLRIPPLTTVMRYSSRIKAEAVLRMGFYNTLGAVKKLLKKKAGGKSDGAIRALEESVRRMKEELRNSIADHFADYKENLKFQYFFRLVDAVSSNLYEALVDRMRAFTGSLSDMSGLVENQRAERDRVVEELASLETSAGEVLERIRKAEGLLGKANELSSR